VVDAYCLSQYITIRSDKDAAHIFQVSHDATYVQYRWREVRVLQEYVHCFYFNASAALVYLEE
jgi:hypothetical protein